MTIISFTTTFNLSLTPPQFKFSDTSNYAGQGISTSNVNGCFTITSPSGIVIYNNTDFSDGGCDIKVSSSVNNQTTIALPLDGNGLVEQGIYNITYTVYDKNLLTDSTKTNAQAFVFTIPVVQIQQIVDCLSPLFTSKDITDYVVNGVTPTIVEVHTIDYPYGSGGQGSPTVGSTLIVTSSLFYNGTQTTTIASTLTYVFPDGSIIKCSVSGVKEIQVDCKDVCGIYCCIRSIEQQMNDARCTNNETYDTLSDLFAQIMGYVSLVMLAIRCGKSDDVSSFLIKIRTLSHCTEDCNCNGTSPTQVTGLGGLVNNVVVQSGGTPVVVTPVTVGNTTTYTVTLSSTFINLVNSFYTTVVAGRNYITVDDLGITNSVRTFVVNGEETDIISSDSSIGITQLYATSGSFIVGIKYKIVNYVPGDNFTNIGGANVTGNIFVATGTTPTAWTNGSTVNVVGLQLLDLSVNLINARNETNFTVPFNPTNANNQTVTGATLTIANAGKYDIVYEADLINSTVGAAQSLVYRLVKTGGVALNLDRVALCSVYAIPTVGTPFFPMKIVSTAQVTLAASDVINLNVDSNSANFSILGRSIKIIKIG